MAQKYTILKEYQQLLMMLEDMLRSESTSNIDIDNICNYIFNDYIGTFPADQMPKKIKNNQCFILNTDSSTSANKCGHWVSFIKLNNKLYYYDSYLRSPAELSKFWKDIKLYPINKTDRDESVNELNCGPRSIAVLIIIKMYGLRALDVV